MLKVVDRRLYESPELFHIRRLGALEAEFLHAFPAHEQKDVLVPVFSELVYRHGHVSFCRVGKIDPVAPYSPEDHEMLVVVYHYRQEHRGVDLGKLLDPVCPVPFGAVAPLSCEPLEVQYGKPFSRHNLGDISRPQDAVYDLVLPHAVPKDVEKGSHCRGAAAVIELLHHHAFGTELPDALYLLTEG